MENSESQHSGVTHEFSRFNLLSESSQTFDMDWDNQDVFSQEISLCQDYIDRYKNLTEYYSTLKETLVTQEIKEARNFLNENKEPKKPSKNVKQALKDWTKIKPKTKTKILNQLDGLEFLEEPKKYVHVHVQTTSNIPTFDKNETNIDGIKAHLIDCNNLLQRKKT